ncbi:MAG: SLC13 family permease [Desulfobacterales bacterium]
MLVAPPLTTDMLIVLLTLVLVITLFVLEWVRVDVVGLIVMTLLPLTGVITADDAISGLSSNAVVAIIAVMIIGAGLKKSGIIGDLSHHIVRLAGETESRIMIFLTGSVAIISSFMQNIGAVALFLPVATRISKQLNLPASRILMPMGFAGIVGGCLSLVGSSPLILLNDLMGSWWIHNAASVAGKAFEPFGLFDVTPVGIALGMGGFLYFVLLREYVLPSTKDQERAGFMSSYLDDIYGKRVGKIFELVVPEDFTITSLEELKLRPLYHTTIASIAKDNCQRISLAPARTEMLRPGDVVGLVSTDEHIQQLAKDLGWIIKEDLEVFREDLSPENAGIVEAVVTPHSELAGKSMREIHFRSRYQVSPLAIFRDNDVHLSDISYMKLQHGDALLFHGQWTKFPLMKDKLHLVFTEDIPGEITHPEKAKYAIGCLCISLAMVLGLKIKLCIAFLTGAVGIILSKVLTADEAYKSVDWMTIFLLSGLIPLGIAFEKTGASQYIVILLMNAVGGTMSPLTLMILIIALTTFFTLVVSNVGAAVLLVPLAMNMAIHVGADPRIAALLVGISASNTFILPTHQVNALIMRPGGYSAMDYVRAGTGMTAIFAAVTLGMLYYVYPLFGLLSI